MPKQKTTLKEARKMMMPNNNDLLPTEELEALDTVELSVDTSDVGERLDSYISKHTELTRSIAARLIDDGMVTVSSLANVQKNTRLRGGEKILIKYPLPQECDMRAEDISLDIIYEDRDILVVNKPVGMVVHPAPGNYSGTLCNALLYHCADSLSGIGGVKRPGIVHRIDKDTSGLLVVAKNDAAHLHLAEQLKTHTVSRIYHAICIGNIKEDNGTVNKPIGRNPTDRKKMAVFANGSTSDSVREAITHFAVLERFGTGATLGQSFTHIRCRLETGRTHQIRVHLASGGHPLLGDPVYGGDGTKFQKIHRELITGQMLHARELSLIHPTTGKLMHFECDLPQNFARSLELLRTAAEV